MNASGCTASAPQASPQKKAVPLSSPETSSPRDISWGEKKDGSNAVSLEALWRRYVAECRSSKGASLLATALSRGCPLSIEGGVAHVGFPSRDRMSKEQCRRAQKDIETWLSRALGAPVALSIDEVEDKVAQNSMAAVEKSHQEDREDTLKRECATCEAVVLAKKVLGAYVEHIEPAVQFNHFFPSFANFPENDEFSSDD